uniref:Uncharacterized protein n=1 Tax=Pyxicephalus adspersus TaxID=30357 RepID=A0AAV3A895_PYXAD|nr:TPA: hypothetical protein GDO54_017265 [Pyxicephalus adspersus]
MDLTWGQEPWNCSAQLVASSPGSLPISSSSRHFTTADLQLFASSQILVLWPEIFHVFLFVLLHSSHLKPFFVSIFASPFYAFLVY